MIWTCDAATQRIAPKYRTLSQAHNVASIRLHEQLTWRDERLGELCEHVHQAAVTGLGSKVHFTAQLREQLGKGKSADGGAVV